MRTELPFEMPQCLEVNQKPEILLGLWATSQLNCDLSLSLFFSMWPTYADIKLSNHKQDVSPSYILAVNFVYPKTGNVFGSDSDVLNIFI